MRLLLIPVLAVLWSPLPATDDEVSCATPAGIGDDPVAKCKRGCNAKCSGANNKSKCVAECRRACER